MELFEFLEVLPSEFVEIKGVRKRLFWYQIIVLVPYSLCFAGSQVLPIEGLSLLAGDILCVEHGIYGSLGPSCLSNDSLSDSDLLIIYGLLCIYSF